MSTTATDWQQVDADPADIQHLSHLASAVLDEHVNHDGLCALCGWAFPCEFAVLAEHNLALL